MVVVSCGPPSAFLCQVDAECTLAGGQEGLCQESGFCSFPDEECESGYRYPSGAGELAGQCVEPQPSGTGDGDGDGTEGIADGGGDDGANTSTTSDSVDDVADTFADTFADTNVDDPPLPLPVCGNGIAEGSEVCDGDDIPTTYCIDLGWFTGTLSCASDCQGYDESLCTNCGNGKVDAGEVCESNSVPDISCTALGYQAGPLGCSGCGAFDVADCMGVVCQQDPPQLNLPCPSQCASCNDVNGCVMDCEGGSACSGATIQCPEGWPCTVVCNGGGACADATVNCPTYTSCEVQCMGGGACDGLDLQCGDAGACQLDCLNSTACHSPTVQCGLDLCGATCVTDHDLQFECGAACLCDDQCSTDPPMPG